MDAKFAEILDALPDKPPRSRLEPYREFILELALTWSDVRGHRRHTRGKMRSPSNCQRRSRFRTNTIANEKKIN